ncbi:MAG: L,D-transpeptidase, partial [Chloroflexota bacterium]|nr:L,D-transpeptidase [Chloroflexota bacterium]
YTMDEGSDVYRVTGPSQPGWALDGPAAARLALAALTAEGAGREIALPVAVTPPGVTEADVAAMEPERWVSVDLTAQRMHAMVGKRVVYTAVISSGKRGWETPTGTYQILWRVENETMTSASIGAEEYYRLENVLYTQYFTGDGHALHYSWWKEPGSFGWPSSHGCVSETLADAEYFWDFARVGTRITIVGTTPRQ